MTCSYVSWHAMNMYKNPKSQNLRHFKFYFVFLLPSFGGCWDWHDMKPNFLTPLVLFRDFENAKIRAQNQVFDYHVPMYSPWFGRSPLCLQFFDYLISPS